MTSPDPPEDASPGVRPVDVVVAILREAHAPLDAARVQQWLIARGQTAWRRSAGDSACGSNSDDPRAKAYVERSPAERQPGAMRTTTLALFVASVVLTLDARDAAAQSTTGTIYGVVKDAKTHDVLEGVTVVATSPAMQGSASELTDDDGTYLLTNLPAGTYEVVFYYGTGKQRNTGVVVRVATGDMRSASGG